MPSDHRTIPPDGSDPTAQPRWRDDYPIDTDREAVNTRRSFLKFMIGASACMSCGQFALLASEADWVASGADDLRPGEPRRITSLSELPVGEALLFAYPGPHDPCLLVRLDQDELVAYSQKCTHLQCPVVPQPQEDRLYCPCHNGAFDLKTGRPVQGPPRKALPKVALEQRGDEIWAIGMRPGEATA